MQPDHYVLPPGARTLLLDLGVSVSNVLRRAGLPADLFTRTPLKLSAEEFHDFWTALDEEVGDPALPLRIAQALRTEHFQVPIFAALCSPNLRVATDRIAEHKRLVGPIRLAVDDAPDGFTITPRWPATTQPPAVLVVTELLFWVALTRIATRADVRPLRLRVPHPPDAKEAYREYLGVTVELADTPSVTFSRLDAQRPFLTADAAMWEFFAPELRRRISDLDREASTTDRVRAALHELLPAGGGTMPRVAGELSISARTLQRRLAEEGTTFQVVLNATREALARHYLTQSQLPAGEISFLLGYDDANSFYRAFNAWTGTTPQQVRHAATA